MDDLLTQETFNKDLIQVFDKLIKEDLESFLTYCVYTKNLIPIKNVIAHLRVYQFKNECHKGANRISF